MFLSLRPLRGPLSIIPASDDGWKDLGTARRGSDAGQHGDNGTDESSFALMDHFGRDADEHMDILVMTELDLPDGVKRRCRRAAFRTPARGRRRR